MRKVYVSLVIVVCGLIYGILKANEAPPISQKPSVKIQENFGKILLYFEKNEGQSGDEIDFISRGQGYGLYVKPTESVIVLAKDSFKMKLKGANDMAKGSGLDKQDAKINYFKGNDPSQWKTGIPTYAKVKYDQVYPGIDVVYYGNQKKLEYDFVVAPEADYSQIALQFEGAKKITINDQGDLVLTMQEGEELVQEKPKVYQEIDKEKKIIDGSYVLKGEDEVGFVVAAYDSTKPLVIDPTWVYSTFFGGDGGYFGSGSTDTAANGIAIDSSGNAYLTGWTTSANYFPLVNEMQSSYGGAQDAFISKLSADGSTLIYSTFLGGNAADEGADITVDASGNAYVTGSTASENFPITTDAVQTDHGGGLDDAFVVKLGPDGSVLLYSTYLGGEGLEGGGGINLDTAGHIYVTGWTNSSDFPTVNALQSTYGGSTEGDAFVSKFNPDGSALVYSTFLGGSGVEAGTSIATDTAGNAYITGFTTSDNFPTANAFQSSRGGAQDAFISKFIADGSTLAYSTYLGGSSTDSGHDIAVDSGGNAYITGSTKSNNFPTANAFQPNFAGAGDAFVGDAFISKINFNGSTLSYSTYFGGSNDDAGYGIAVDATRNIYITGWTTWEWGATIPFPVPGYVDPPTYGGESDAFASRFSANGSVLIYSIEFIGQEDDKGFGIAVDAGGDAYVTGWTHSANFQTIPSNVYQPNFTGDMAAFVTKLSCNGSAIYYHDQDNDGYGDRQDSVQSCNTPILGVYISTAGDCNDTNASINPGATESCNKVDDNCNGKVDEGFRWMGKKCYRLQIAPR